MINTVLISTKPTDLSYLSFRLGRSCPPPGGQRANDPQSRSQWPGSKWSHFLLENAKGWLQKRWIFGECARPPGFFLGAFDLVKRYFEEQHRL